MGWALGMWGPIRTLNVIHHFFEMYLCIYPCDLILSCQFFLQHLTGFRLVLCI